MSWPDGYDYRVERRVQQYNEERPHSSLGYLASREFAQQLEERAEISVMSSGDLDVV